MIDPDTDLPKIDVSHPDRLFNDLMLSPLPRWKTLPSFFSIVLHLFFLIEDNAVYLSEKYDQRFGIFTGKESFKGIVEVLNDSGEVLLRTTGLFRGWQR